MKMFLLSDNIDTLIGMRFSGIEGIVVKTSDEFEKEFDKACSDSEIAVLFIAKKLTKLSPERVGKQKIRNGLPLVIEIPDRFAFYDMEDG